MVYRTVINLFVDDIHLVTKIKKNMENSLMNLYDKIMLRKRSLIETIDDELKNACHIEHTRHRSIDNFASNLIADLLRTIFYQRSHLQILTLLTKEGLLNDDAISNSRMITVKSIVSR